MSDHKLPDFNYKAEMGFTHYELLKGLPSAVKPYEIKRVSPLVYEMRFEDRLVNLVILPETIRKIASIELPVTSISLDFFEFEAAQYDTFMDRFKRYLHRGGG
ncbi:MAG: hypothetical protein GKR96_04910 [Gammaproteobacteria bacterium]|nr:hypothetical protein [Gammaproteobacteria bacterium]